MSLVLTEDQQMLARTAGAFIAEHSKVARLRKLRDSRDERGYSLDVYKKMADLGWTAIPFSEADGGIGLGLADLIVVTEAMGRALAPEPLIPSLALAGQALAAGGNAAQKDAWLAPAIAGEKVLALASSEAQSRYDLANVTTRAEKQGAAYRITGEKTGVWGGHRADAYLVAARTSGDATAASGITLFLVPADAKGVSSERQVRVDSLNASIVRFAQVEVTENDVVGAVGEGYSLLSIAVDRATVALCGEMLGGMSEAFDRTVAYLKERKQFGAAIGTFQALKHRAARIYIEIELARSAVMAAARAFDESSAEAPALASLAKARLSDVYTLVVNEAVQMHGGIGMTDEHEIGFFMKRARACEMTFGDAAYHRDRFARLSGY